MEPGAAARTAAFDRPQYDANPRQQGARTDIGLGSADGGGDGSGDGGGGGERTARRGGGGSSSTGGFVTGATKRGGHKASVTCVALGNDERLAFSASKDCTIVRWDLAQAGGTPTKVKHYRGERRNRGGVRGDGRVRGENGHTARIMSLALSSDGRFLASGGHDRTIRIWDVRTDEVVHVFRGHRAAVSALAFRNESYELLSGSYDRSVRLWSVADMAYVESLFGHQSEIHAVDTFAGERAVTCGGDGTVRLWEVADETQLVFRGHRASIDCCAAVGESHVISGSQDGTIALWNTARKRPVCTRTACGSPAAGALAAQNNHSLPWITSVAALRNSDIVASGASDGFVRLWQVNFKRQLLSSECVAMFPVAGFVNGMAFAPSGKFIFCGVGQEHRLGRWERIKSAKNGVCVIARGGDSVS